MSVLLIGACSSIGRSVARTLADEGHDVIGLVRSGTEADAPASLATTHSSTYDISTLHRHMQGMELVVNIGPPMPVGTAILRPGAWRLHDRTLVQGTARVVAAARAAQVKRVIHVGSSLLYASAGDERIDEECTVGLTGCTEPAVLAESSVQRFGYAHGEHVILRFGQIVGDEPYTRWMVRRARSGRPTGFGMPDSWQHLLHLNDAGTAVAAAISAPVGTYNVGAEPCQRQELCEQYAIAGQRFGARFHSSALLRLGGDRLEMLSRSQRVSSERYTDLTGWYPQLPKLTGEWLEQLQ